MCQSVLYCLVLSWYAISSQDIAKKADNEYGSARVLCRAGQIISYYRRWFTVKIWVPTRLFATYNIRPNLDTGRIRALAIRLAWSSSLWNQKTSPCLLCGWTLPETKCLNQDVASSFSHDIEPKPENDFRSTDKSYLWISKCFWCIGTAEANSLAINESLPRTVLWPLIITAWVLQSL